MDAPIKLLIVSPAGTLTEDFAESILLPGSDGSYGIRKNHRPAIIQLRPGAVLWSVGEHRNTVKISGGVAEVSNNVVTVLTD